MLLEIIVALTLGLSAYNRYKMYKMERVLRAQVPVIESQLHVIDEVLRFAAEAARAIGREDHGQDDRADAGDGGVEPVQTEA